MTLSDLTIEHVIETFELLDDWEERYRYIIDLGRKLPKLPEHAYRDENKVRGCVSQVWLICEYDENSPPALSFKGDSDAHIVKGLIAILFLIFSGRRAEDILATDARAILDQLGLANHLSPLRTNGLFSMVKRIGHFARNESAAA